MSDDANRSDATSNDITDQTAGEPVDNQSIIGIVKSRVSNILPNSLYKWFSPSAKTSDSINGSLSNDGIGMPNARRRRRLELEEEDDAEEEERADDDQNAIEYNENLLRNPQHSNNTDEESNSDEEAPTSSAASAAKSCKMSARRSLNTSLVIREPPTKRSRFTEDNTNTRRSLLIQRQPLQSSTPTLNSETRTIIESNRYSHLNLYDNQNTNEPSSAFNSTVKTTIDSVPSSGVIQTSASSSNRGSLQIDDSSNVTHERSDLTPVRRKKLTVSKGAILSISSGIAHNKSTVPRTSTGEEDMQNIASTTVSHRDQFETTKCNGRTLSNKRQRLINGSGSKATKDINQTNNLEDSSASESSEGGADMTGTVVDIHCNANMSRKTGIFNMVGSSRQGSRTSSIGNGLNFYSHLEGRKSLFSGAQSSSRANTMNNSTLSLTSLNRRQFNASIYGSTSALSDSRLLNTNSPFYQGRTTYGGAAAYNKYASRGTGAGASAVHITPTLIRPTSSLSTLSSSSNSLAAGGSNTVGAENAALSSTTKRILDCINEFATPLTEAKKMAIHLKDNQQQQTQLLPQMKTRLNDSHLETTRALRLSRVRTPYMRPTVVQQPNAANLNGQTSTQLPPVRELQVPSMSQLLQLKKMQNTTERSRQIARHCNATIQSHGAPADYTLPIVAEDASDGPGEDKKSHQTKHTNKIRHKVTASARMSTSVRDMYDDAPPPPINLPNIAFPLMQSAPKIDITLPTAAPAAVPTAIYETASGGHGIATTQVSLNIATSANSVAMVTSNTPTTTVLAEGTNVGANFKFSPPLELENVSTSTQNVTPISGNYKFSSPTSVKSQAANPAAQAETPKAIESVSLLKTGSVLDILKKPFTVPATAESTVTPSIETSAAPATAATFGFGKQFKKSSNEWDCNVCMVRNKSEANKCVACDTPRQSADASVTPRTIADTITATQSTNPPVPASFGVQFKKPVGEWECDACMVRNKPDVNRCVACDSARKGASVATDSSATSQTAKSTSFGNNSFGDAFKPKDHSWECSTCLVQNRSNSTECVACQAKKPGADASIKTAAAPAAPMTRHFKFGLSSGQKTDAGFEALAADQKASTWECDACMARNDAARPSCACCDQAKPGSMVIDKNVPAFSFGSTSAAKFKFGFGAVSTMPATIATVSTAPITTALTMQATNTQPKNNSVFGSGGAMPSNGGFSFGFNPVNITEASTNIADTQVTSNVGPNFRVNTTDANIAIADKFAEQSFCTTASTSESVTLSSSAMSVQYNLPTTASATVATINTTEVDNNNKTNTAPLTTPSFIFGSSSPSNSGGINPAAIFGSDNTLTLKLSTTPATAVTATTNAGTNVSQASILNFNSPASSIAAKPMFSFGASVATATTTLNSVTTSTSTPTSSGCFSFGGNGTAPLASSKPIFGAATQPATTATAIPTNAPGGSIFGTSFGNPTANASGTFGFGASEPAANYSKSDTSTINATTAPTFGSFGAGTNTATSSTPFGAFGGQRGGEKPTASAPSFFGNSGTADAPTNSNATFVFGKATTAAGSSAAPTNTTVTSWPQNTFAFDSAASSMTPTAASSSDTNKPVFGGFGATQFNSRTINSSSAPAEASIFGNPTANAPVSNANAFGNATNNIFGSNAALSTGNAATNIFGSATSTFGASAFGGATGTAAPTTFGGFSVAAATPAPTDGASAPKKSEPAFNFGGPTAQTASSGFYFGAAAAAPKPAFNFNATSQQPSFNFTGSTELHGTSPFQFGAVPTAPVFNFSGGSFEASPNAPFQFNAGATPASSNIFAPNPMPGGQNAQQARRKIRTPMRRLTPR